MSDDLSRLLDGELSLDEAAALRERIARDPALAARWARMQALGGRIRDLPREVPRPRRSWGWTGWVAAAALALFLLRPAPARVLVAGTERVEGRAEVLAGDVVVEVDGKVSITVEPPAGRPRGAGAEVTDMDKKALIAALAGSVVTVTVLEGVAWMKPADAAPIEVKAGTTRVVGEKREKDAPAVAGESPATPPQERVAQLERELARAKLEKALVSGQLRRHEGVAQEWPADVPTVWKPEGFEAFLRERVAAIPEAEIVAVDCEEYPCVAIVRSHSKAEDWEDQLVTTHDDLEGAGFGDGLHVTGMGRMIETDKVDARLYGWAVTPAGEDDELRHRVRYRTESALEDVSTELMEAP
ncbi:MAG: hypothetical protein ACOZNI_37600 [Myxococcota bacterium]